MTCGAIYPKKVKGNVRWQNQWYPMEWRVVHCLSQSYTAVLHRMAHIVLTINPKRVQTTLICFCLQFKKSWFGPFLDPSVSVIWMIQCKWWWMARWFKLITTHSWWPRSAALRLQVEHKRPALDDGHKQPRGSSLNLQSFWKLKKKTAFIILYWEGVLLLTKRPLHISRFVNVDNRPRLAPEDNYWKV